MNKKAGGTSLINWMAARKNTIFLFMCLGVHASYLIVFLCLHIFPFVFLNIFSTAFYIIVLIYCKDRISSEASTVYAYFEILIFSLICETIARNSYGFIFFVMGMIPTIFFLAPSYGKKRFAFQFAGVACGILMNQMVFLIPDSYFQTNYAKLIPYASTFTFVNLLISLFTMLYVSFFYKLDIDVMRSELEYQCTHDALTGLYNRRFLYDEIKNTPAETVVVALMDIDNFKRINDQYGHDKGDDILIAVSDLLKEEAKQSGAFSVRWGGEEFVLYYTALDTDTVYEHLCRLCKTIRETVLLPDQTSVTLTTGLSGADGCSDFDKAIKEADNYLYLGKNGGKNCIVRKENAVQFTA